MATGTGGWAASPAEFVRRVLVAAHEDKVFFLASALTFDALLAAVPFVLLLLAALGQFVQAGDDALADMVALLQRFVPTGPGARDPAREAELLLTSVASARSSLSVYGIPLFLWFSTRLFSSVRAALNDVFDTRESRSWWRGKAIDFGFVLLALVLVVVNTLLSLSLFGTSFLGRVLTSFTTFTLGVGFFIGVYMVAPTRRVRWDTALVAAAVASLMFGVAKRLYTIYLVEFTTFDRLISNANVLAALLLVVWFYVTACAFVIGAEVAETYDMRRRQREQRMMLA